jgi:methionyl-tRNA formyltransferase
MVFHAEIIFMGTPDFAVPTLRKLIDSEHKLVAVFTQKPKAQDRGMKLKKSPVHLLAESYNIPIYTPEKLRDPSVIQQLKDIEADLIVVVAYGFIIPKEILESKKYGCLNLHPSSLPTL